jgi:hypothetical protein
MRSCCFSCFSCFSCFNRFTALRKRNQKLEGDETTETIPVKSFHTRGENGRKIVADDMKEMSPGVAG